MSSKIPVIAIIGRTNVGKSTLFNAIAGRRLSIVDDSHGVTRDRNYAYLHRYELPFSLIDTGGLIGEEDSELQDAVRAQAEVAIQEADLVLAVFDGLYGPHPHDGDVVDLLRRSGKPVLWVINKCEKPMTEASSSEFYALGIDELTCVSAAHKLHVDKLVEKTREVLEPLGFKKGARDASTAVRVAVLGKPNAGKSTLINKILGEDRLVTSDIAGTTRDNIDISLTREGKDYVIVDTAGLRKKSAVESLTVERYSNLRALKALVACDVAVLVLDGTLGAPSEQDAKIAGLIHERGRAMIIVVNKWDAVEKDHQTVKAYERAVYEQLKFARYAPILFTSALTGRRCPSVLETVQSVYDAGQQRIPTAELNKVLSEAFMRKPPPVYRGEPIKLFFATQTEIAPPTIVLFVNYPKEINFSYERYLRNALRKHYPYVGNDIRLVLRKRTDKAERLTKAENL
jgi:GTP-binding protein